jgi:hypothetical protein
MLRPFLFGGSVGIAALTLAACSDSTGPSTATLAAVSPAPAATAVTQSTTITLTFGQPMMAGMEQYMDLHQGSVGGSTVPMNCAWSSDQTTMTCTPTNPLAAGTQYTIHVGAGMTDGRGHLMDMDNWTTRGGQWANSGMMGGTHAGQPVAMMGPGWKQGTHYGMLFTFSTAGPAPATLVAVSPTPGATTVSTSSTITLTFGQPMMAGMEQHMDLHQGGITGSTVPMSCVWSLDQATLTCTPTNPLAAGTQYTIHVGGGMTDAEGHMMDLDSWTSMGGQWATGGMIGGTHAGQPIGMMGPGWMHGSDYGMLFTFTTS